MPTFIGLLRGVNVGSYNKVPMAELRSLCGNDLGWRDVQTYIQSGNLVFRADASPERLEADLEQALEARFGSAIEAIVRSEADWGSYVTSNPFPDASRESPNHVLLALSKAPPKLNTVEGLRERASDDERIRQVDDALWIHYGGGIARSKLSPAVLNRLVGSPVTARNWRTVLKLESMAGDVAS